MMSNTQQATILKVLYESGFHFTLTTNKIVVQDAYNPDEVEKIAFVFDEESEELVDISSIKPENEQGTTPS